MTRTTSKFEMVLKNDVREGARLRKAVDEFTAVNGFPESEKFELQLCLQTATMNIVKHGFDDSEEHDIDIQMLFQRNRRILTIGIVDDGEMSESLGGSSLSNRDSKAQQLSFQDSGCCAVRKYSDHLSYFRQGRYNHLILSRIIPKGPSSSAGTPAA